MKIQVAVHELGHSAVSRTLGFGAWSVQILPSGSGLFKPSPRAITPTATALDEAVDGGHFRAFAEQPVDELTVAAVALSMGGLVAEQIHSKERLISRFALYDGTSSDERIARLYMPNSLDRLAVQRATFCLMDDLMSGIEVGAKLLDATGYLNSDQIEGCFTGQITLNQLQ